MIISNAVSQSGLVQNLQKSGQSGRVKGVDSSSKTDSVNISSGAKKADHASIEKSAVSARTGALPDVRSEKIAEVKEKIANGFYDSPEFNEKLAERIIQNHWN